MQQRKSEPAKETESAPSSFLFTDSRNHYEYHLSLGLKNLVDPILSEHVWSSSLSSYLFKLDILGTQAALMFISRDQETLELEDNGMENLENSADAFRDSCLSEFEIEEPEWEPDEPIGDDCTIPQGLDFLAAREECKRTLGPLTLGNIEGLLGLLSDEIDQRDPQAFISLDLDMLEAAVAYIHTFSYGPEGKSRSRAWRAQAMVEALPEIASYRAQPGNSEIQIKIEKIPFADLEIIQTTCLVHLKTSGMLSITLAPESYDQLLGENESQRSSVLKEISVQLAARL